MMSRGKEGLVQPAPVVHTLILMSAGGKEGLAHTVHVCTKITSRADTKRILGECLYSRKHRKVRHAVEERIERHHSKCAQRPGYLSVAAYDFGACADNVVPGPPFPC